MSNQQSLLQKVRVRNVPHGWKIKTVGEACLIRNDLRKPIALEERDKIQGIYPYYGPTGILGYINNYLAEGCFALIGEDGDHFLKYASKNQTLLVKGKFNVNNHAHLIEATKECTAEWFYHFFKHRNITSFLSRQGAGRYKLNKDTLRRLPIIIPPSSEQIAVADMLSTWDQAIEKTERLITTKEKQLKSLIKKHIVNNSEKKKWGNYPLGNLIIERNEKSTVHNQYPTITSSRRGICLQTEYFSKSVTSIDNASYKIIKKGDFTYRSMSDDGIFIFNRLMQIDIGIISPAYGVFYADSVDSDYLHYLLNSSYFKRALVGESQGGTRTALKLSSIKKINIDLPIYTMQKTITAILNTVQLEVDLLKKQLEAYRQQKRGLMQKLLTGQWRVKLSKGA
jgi:type I restriction enzyme S subunit